MGFQTTYTGMAVSVMDMTCDDIDVRDIARSLAMKPRFNGWMTSFYSVAEHCCNVFDMLKTSGKCSDITLLYGLMHDSEEAYWWDVPGPLKHANTPLSKMLREEMAKTKHIIMRRYGLHEIYKDSYPAQIVKAADNAVFLREVIDIAPMTKFAPGEFGDVVWDGPCWGWTWEEAEDAFLARFHGITAQLNERRVTVAPSYKVH